MLSEGVKALSITESPEFQFTCKKDFFAAVHNVVQIFHKGL